MRIQSFAKPELHATLGDDERIPPICAFKRKLTNEDILVGNLSQRDIQILTANAEVKTFPKGSYLERVTNILQSQEKGD